MTSAARRYLIAGNWKMYKTLDEARDFTRQLYNQAKAADSALADIVLCPPATALERVAHTVRELQAPFAVGAQTMESREQGAYTGEISPGMAVDCGATYVIIGHSERREYYNETDATVNAKIKAALAHDLTPIICVGESLAQREDGVTDDWVAQQVNAAIEGLDAAVFPKLTFAYEPIWAIGTGKTCEAAEANRVCALIRRTLAQRGAAQLTRILYGGSVKPDNSRELLSQSDIDGALVGGASLDPEGFTRIINDALALVAQPAPVS
ncbi:MAG: triose-phosphate isomerase [Vampirovibrionales bacterium]|nr:triose-phosphate isomerase [Vampirovibrionales bacterium]